MATLPQDFADVDTNSDSTETSPKKSLKQTQYKGLGFNSRAIHAGNEPDGETGAICAPIYMTSTYVQEWPSVTRSGYDYSRAGNPNFSRLEQQIASLEGGRHAVVMGSGLATFTSLLTHVISKSKQTDPHAVVRVGAIQSLYGGTHRLLSKVFKNMGVEIEFAQAGDYDSLERVLSGGGNVANLPLMFIVESPTNPLLEVVDLAKLSAIRSEVNASCILVVDNTFATPYHQSPLSLGADVVVHSSTKYFGGHSDVLGGALITNSTEIAEAMKFQRLSMGLNPSPFDTWLIGRSIKTLGIRVSQQSCNAAALAQMLEKHPKVKRVIYPGLKSHPDYEVATRQMVKGFGGMISVEFNLTLEETKQLVSLPFSVLSLAESLGAVETLLNHPASMTHASIPEPQRNEIGISDGLIRISVGVEDVQDIISDFEWGLSKV